MKGFTFIELIVVVGLTMFLFTGAVAGYNRFTDVSRLRQAALTFKNDLRLTQSKALAGQKPINLACDQLVGYEVSFTATTYDIQAQCHPAQLFAPNSTFTLPSNVKFSPIPSPLTFGILTQGVNINSDVTFTFVSGSRNYAIRVTPQGEIIDVGLQ